MGGVVVRQLDSVEALERYAPAWNELWSRSASVRPTARAEHLAIWLEAFAAGSPFLGLLAEYEGRAVAALPLVGGRLWGFPAALSVGNAWSPGGELLIDPDCDAPRVIAALVEAMRKDLPPLVAIDGLVLGSPPVEQFLDYLHTSQVASVARQRFSVALLNLSGDWPAYLASRSRNHRRQMRIIARRAEEQGGVTLQRHEALRIDEVEPLLRRCFEVEAAGWKGREGTAVLCSPGAWEFYLRQARELASAGELSLSVLEHRGRVIAFEYSWNCRRVRAVLKIGYDEAYARLSPGQLLRYHLLAELFEQQATRAIDYIGPATDATAAWATDRYEVGRLVLAASGVFAGAAVAGSRWGGPLVRRFRGASQTGELRPAGR